LYLLSFCLLRPDLSLPGPGTLDSGGGGARHRPVPWFCSRAPCPACDLAFPGCDPSNLVCPASPMCVWEEVVGSTHQKLLRA
ncbi:unnamed protein product, partial [Gulo gulo]